MSIPYLKKPGKNRIYRISVSSFFFLAGLCFSSWASRIPDIQASLGLSNARLGGVLLALPCGLILSLPLAGWLVHKMGSKSVVIIAALIYACCLPLLGFALKTTQLMAGLFIFGLGGNMLNISINTQAVGTEILYGRPIIASYHGIWSLAGFSGAAIGTLLVRFRLTPSAHFLLISCIALLIIVSANTFLLKTDNSPAQGGSFFKKPDPAFLNLGLIAFCSMICEGAMFDWSGVYFQKVVHSEKAWVTAGYTAFMCSMATGRFVGDRITLRIGRKKTMQWSAVFAAGGLLIAVVFPYFIPAVIGFLLVGAGVSSIVPLVYSAAGKSGKLNPGVAIAAVSTIGYLGFLFGPPCIGFVAQVSSLRVSLALISCLAALTIYLARRTDFAE